MDNSEKFLESLALDPDSLNRQVLSFSSFFNILLAAALGFMVLLVYLKNSSRERRDRNLYTVIPVLTILMAVVMRIDSSKAGSFFAIFGVLSIIRFRSDITDQKGVTFILFAVIEGLIVGLNAYLLALAAWVVVSGSIMAGRRLFRHRERFRLTLRCKGLLPEASRKAVEDWLAAKGLHASPVGLDVSSERSKAGEGWKVRTKAEYLIFTESERELLALAPGILELASGLELEAEIRRRGAD